MSAVTGADGDAFCQRFVELCDAEVQLVEGAAPRWLFDSAGGSLRVSFSDAEIILWGRVGENLLWLGLGEDGDMAALVFGGISRDPGGGAQAAWLKEVCAG